jgi:hypothetical protein
MINLFGAQFAALQIQLLTDMNDITEVAFLSSRLQLWSYALLDDMRLSADLLEIFQQAQTDATNLIQLCSTKNLSAIPFHVCRAIAYSAMMLIKILKSPYAIQQEVILDYIEQARQALSSAVNIDIVKKSCQILQELPFVEDKKRTPQIYTRMTASITYNCLRVFFSEPRNMTMPVSGMHLDGFDWDNFEL